MKATLSAFLPTAHAGETITVDGSGNRVAGPGCAANVNCRIAPEPESVALPRLRYSSFVTASICDTIVT